MLYHNIFMIATSQTATKLTSVIIRPASMGDIYPILGLHSEAFADKFGAAFGARGQGQGIEAMAEAWRRQGTMALRGMYVAVLDHQVIGTITMRTWEMSHDTSGAAEAAFHQVLGPWRAMRSIFALSLLDHAITRDEGYVTDVAVLSAYRRKGVAQLLLDEAEQQARLRNKHYLSLYVSAGNAGARTLYTRQGFTEHQRRRSWLAGWILRQRVWIYMRKELL